ncbi:hypothetical protein QVD17_18850 [Tagetes erecta]|uniref:Homeodomain-like protein n=1 Tax=Tagetes erecta TaxID=13708 RepID=A0AAD8KLG7_TARER|nr:hypothetical protein QVD17_18850 [Tagetes erecta]
MVKTSSFDTNNELKKGAWSEEEDQKLRAYIQRYGHWNWGLLPKFAGLSRSGKSCRLRWMNYLRPNIKHGNFTREEDDLIVHLHNTFGNKWSTIATKLPGRSDNEIKNRWNTHLKKRAKDDHMVLETDHHGTIQPADQDQANPNKNQELQLQNEGNMNLAVLSSHSPSCSTHTALSPGWLSGSDCGVTSNVASQTSDDFWTDTFLEDIITSSVDSMFSPLNAVDDLVTRCSYEDIMIDDQLSWSMLYSYNEYNDFINF